MFTFNETYVNPSYQYLEGADAFKEYVMDMLNTDRGSRPYYPDYGSLISRYKYALLTVQTAQEIHADVYYTISSMDNVTIIRSNYKTDIANRRVELYYDIVLGQEPIGLHMTYSDGEVH